MADNIRIDDAKKAILIKGLYDPPTHRIIEEEKSQITYKESDNQEKEQLNNYDNDDIPEDKGSENENDKDVHKNDKDVHKNDKDVHKNDKDVHRNDKDVHKNDKDVHKNDKDVHRNDKDIHESEYKDSTDDHAEKGVAENEQADHANA